MSKGMFRRHYNYELSRCKLKDKKREGAMVKIYSGSVIVPVGQSSTLECLHTEICKNMELKHQINYKAFKDKVYATDKIKIPDNLKLAVKHWLGY